MPLSAWREFYADVLWRRPRSAYRALQPAMAFLDVDGGALADDRFRAWTRGLTGYPLVDAGMRQLRAEGWMPNRVRMVVASFLVKDLHIDWTCGARWFMDRLVDGGLASNQHNWQWVAGTGTDPAPTTPDGDYVRRWAPELAASPRPGCTSPGSTTRRRAIRPRSSTTPSSGATRLPATPRSERVDG